MNQQAENALVGDIASLKDKQDQVRQEATGALVGDIGGLKDKQENTRHEASEAFMGDLDTLKNKQKHVRIAKSVLMGNPEELIAKQHKGESIERGEAQSVLLGASDPSMLMKERRKSSTLELHKMFMGDDYKNLKRRDTATARDFMLGDLLAFDEKRMKIRAQEESKRKMSTGSEDVEANPEDDEDFGLEEDEPDPFYEAVVDCALNIGIHPELDPQLLWIAEECVRAPIPVPWVRKTRRHDDSIYYANKENGETQNEHPLYARYREFVVWLKIDAVIRLQTRVRMLLAKKKVNKKREEERKRIERGSMTAIQRMIAEERRKQEAEKLHAMMEVFMQVCLNEHKTNSLRRLLGGYRAMYQKVYDADAIQGPFNIRTDSYIHGLARGMGINRDASPQLMWLAEEAAWVDVNKCWREVQLTEEVEDDPRTADEMFSRIAHKTYENTVSGKFLVGKEPRQYYYEVFVAALMRIAATIIQSMVRMRILRNKYKDDYLTTRKPTLITNEYSDDSVGEYYAHVRTQAYACYFRKLQGLLTGRRSVIYPKYQKDKPRTWLPEEVKRKAAELEIITEPTLQTEPEYYLFPYARMFLAAQPPCGWALHEPSGEKSGVNDKWIHSKTGFISYHHPSYFFFKEITTRLRNKHHMKYGMPRYKPLGGGHSSMLFHDIADPRNDHFWIWDRFKWTQKKLTFNIYEKIGWEEYGGKLPGSLEFTPGQHIAKRWAAKYRKHVRAVRKIQKNWRMYIGMKHAEQGAGELAKIMRKRDGKLKANKLPDHVVTQARLKASVRANKDERLLEREDTKLMRQADQESLAYESYLAYMETHKVEHTAATNIQRVVRGHLARIEYHARSYARLLHRSAIKIQKHMRRYVSMTELYRRWTARRENAACTIQRAYAKFLERQKARALLNAIKEGNRRKRLNNAAILIQKIYRGFSQRLAFVPMVRFRRMENAAALTLQCFLRQYLARRRVNLRRSARRRRVAACTIQRAVRIWLAKRKVAHLKLVVKVIVIQNLWRGYVMRRNFQRMIGGSLKERLRNKGAVVIQRVYRGHLGRKRYRYFNQFRQIRRIQAYVRKIYAKHRVELLRRERNRQRAATTIQRVYRGYRQRFKWYAYQKKQLYVKYRLHKAQTQNRKREACATKIQAAWRGLMGFNRVKNSVWAVRHHKMYLKRMGTHNWREFTNNQLKIYTFNLMVQRSTQNRIRDAYRKLKDITSAIIEVKHGAATKIQTMFRIVALRPIHRAATKIQTIARGYLVRRWYYDLIYGMYMKFKVLSDGGVIYGPYNYPVIHKLKRSSLNKFLQLPDHKEASTVMMRQSATFTPGAYRPEDHVDYNDWKTLLGLEGDGARDNWTKTIRTPNPHFHELDETGKFKHYALSTVSFQADKVLPQVQVENDMTPGLERMKNSESDTLKHSNLANEWDDQTKIFAPRQHLPVNAYRKKTKTKQGIDDWLEKTVNLQRRKEEFNAKQSKRSPVPKRKSGITTGYDDKIGEDISKVRGTVKIKGEPPLSINTNRPRSGNKRLSPLKSPPRPTRSSMLRLHSQDSLHLEEIGQDGEFHYYYLDENQKKKKKLPDMKSQRRKRAFPEPGTPKKMYSSEKSSSPKEGVYMSKSLKALYDDHPDVKSLKRPVPEIVSVTRRSMDGDMVYRSLTVIPPEDKGRARRSTDNEGMSTGRKSVGFDDSLELHSVESEFW